MKTAVAINMVSAFVAESFREATEDFAANPNTENWKNLKKAMFVTQAWNQRRSRIDAIEPWLERMLSMPVLNWPENIVARGMNGATWRDLDFTS